MKCLSITAHLGKLLWSETSGKLHCQQFGFIFCTFFVCTFLFLSFSTPPWVFFISFFVFYSAMFALGIHNNEDTGCMSKQNLWELNEMQKMRTGCTAIVYLHSDRITG